MPFYEINETHDPNLKSWVESANDPNTDFPIQNLPFFCFDRYVVFAVGTRIGDKCLDLKRCFEDGLFVNEAAAAGERCLWSCFELFKSSSKELIDLRARLSEILRADAPIDVQEKVRK